MIGSGWHAQDEYWTGWAGWHVPESSKGVRLWGEVELLSAQERGDCLGIG